MQQARCLLDEVLQWRAVAHRRYAESARMR